MNWAVELGKFDIVFEQRTFIKHQALVDFIVEFTNVPESRKQRSRLSLPFRASSKMVPLERHASG